MSLMVQVKNLIYDYLIEKNENEEPERHRAIDDLTLEEFRQFSPAFDEDIYEAVSVHTCIRRRNTKGAPGPAAMEEELEENRRYLGR